MLIAIRSLRIITIGEERLLSERRSSQERSRYFHFLRNEFESASILHRYVFLRPGFASIDHVRKPGFRNRKRSINFSKSLTKSVRVKHVDRFNPFLL